MLKSNSEGITDVATLTGGAALQKDPFSNSERRKKFKTFIKSCKSKFLKSISKDSLMPSQKQLIAYFEKGKLAQIGEIRTWNDGNKYKKTDKGWRPVGSGDNKAVHQADLKEAGKAGINRSQHRAATEKAMQNGAKIPVKVLREYPTLLDKYPQYKARVSAIDSLSKGMKAGKEVGDRIEGTANELRSGRFAKVLDSARRTLNFGDVPKGFDQKSYDKLWSLDSKIADLNSKVKKKSIPKALMKSGKDKERKAWNVLENKRIASVKKQISELKKTGREVRDSGKPKSSSPGNSEFDTKLKIAQAEAEMFRPPELIPQKGPWQDKVEGLPNETWELHFDGDPNKGGKPTPERQILHDKIMSDYLNQVQPVGEGEQPVVIMMMGGPASGKSSMVRALGIDESKFVVADADAIKERIPEYRVGVRSRARKAAAMAHEESSFLVKQVRAEAIASRKNLVIDGTGAKAKSYLDVIPELRKQGYKIQLLMADCDVDVAVPRAIERAEKVGRFVPENFIRDAYPNIPNSFKSVSPLVDEFHVFDTANAKPNEMPRPLYSKKDGQTVEHDSGWVRKFTG